MSKLAGKIAVISGGTSGIGAAAAKRFQVEGATVIVTGSNPETLAAARTDLPGVEVVACAAEDTAATKDFVADVKARHGRIDVLFANAGVAQFRPSSEVDEAFFDHQFNINVRGLYFLLKYAAPIVADGGSIILTASVSGSLGGAGQTVYGATKAAVRSFGRTFAAELAPRRIRVNTISPGPIETPIFGKAGFPLDQPSEAIDEFKAAVPLARLGQADEVAAAALFLASEDASYTTGAELFVDGGMTGI